MNISELQLQLHQAIDSITDSEKLKAIYTLIKGENGPFRPLSEKEYIDQLSEAQKQIEEGKYLSIEDLETESDKW